MPNDTETRSDRIDVRLTPAAKRTLQQAASVLNKSVSEFLLDSGLNAAFDALADRRVFQLDDAQWHEFQAALSRPPQDNPGLRALLAQTGLERVSPSRPSAPEPICAEHDVSTFTSGVSALDEWLRRRALPNEVAGASRTFVSCIAGRVVGYYSLAAASVVHDVATTRARRNMPDPIPAVVLGRLAIDQGLQGQGLGGDLLQDAVMRTLAAAGSIGVRVLLVHALSDDARHFYARFGFRESAIEPMTLMVTLDEVRRLLGEG